MTLHVASVVSGLQGLCHLPSPIAFRTHKIYANLIIESNLQLPPPLPAATLIPLASTPPGMPGTHPIQYFGWGDVNGNISPILLHTSGHSRPILVAVRSLKLISFGYKMPSRLGTTKKNTSSHFPSPRCLQRV